MEKLELIKVTQQNGEQLVSARELHKKLEITERFNSWFDRMLKYGFIENVDFTSVKDFTVVNNGAKKEIDEYILKMDMAKQICMLQRNELGTKFRLYFIECEKQLKQQFKVPTTFKEALQLALEQQEKIEALELKQEEDRPKVEFFDTVTESKDTVDIGTVAKILNIKGVGRNKLFEILRDKKVLMSNNQPYQKYIDNGWFRQIESKFNLPNGDIKINIKTVVFQKGVNGIKRLMDDNQHEVEI